MRNLQHIKAVTLDVGGTLIRPWPSVGHVYSEVAARHGHGIITPETLNLQFAAAWRAKAGFDHSRRAWLEVVTRTFAGLMPESSVQGFFSDLYDRFARREAWQVFDDVHPALTTLRERGLKLGIISNWDERLRPLLDRLELTPWFQVIVVSAEVGFPKPAREIFAHAASLLGASPASILHVGDSAAEDIAGAESAGFQAVLLDRKATTDSTASIHRLDALSVFLR